MDKNDYVVGMIVDIRNMLEELLDELVPPPAEEAIESATSEAPPPRGVAGGRRGQNTQTRIRSKRPR